ncbi:MAG: glycosyltransferase family 9 protein, partial [Enterobacteriaceae bacterium]
MSEYKKILIVRRDNIGDLVCTTPLIHSLRTCLPQVELDLLVNSYNCAILQNSPDIDHLYSYTKAKHKAATESLLAVYWQRVKLIWTLRRKKYDAVILTSISRGALERQVRWAKQIGAQRVIALCATDDPLSKHIDYPIAIPDCSLHEVELNMLLLQPLTQVMDTPGLHIYASDQATTVAREQLTTGGLSTDKLLIGLHISARKVSQRWSVERFVELIQTMARQIPGAQFVLFWSPGSANNPLHPGDDEKAQEILQACQDLPLIGFPSSQLEQLMGGIALLDAMICSDGGAMHIAAGLGKPIVCMFGDSDAEHWYPWGVPYELLQPESRNVMDITVPQLIEAWDRLCEKAAIPLQKQ